MNLAIVSPSKNAYSETFIQAHKDLIKGNIYFYHSGLVPTQLEGLGSLLGNTPTVGRINRIKYKLSPQYKHYSIDEMMFAKSLKENKIEAVLAEYGTTGAKIMPVCKKLNLPLYVFFHGNDASIKERLEEYMSAYLAMFEYATKVFVVSRAMYEQILNLGCSNDKLILNTYGPNDDFLALQPSFGKKKVMAVGRFVDKKAPYFTILAFNKVLEAHPDAELYFAGDGYLFNACINLIKYLKIEKNIFLLGAISPSAFKMHLTESCLFIQHSITALNGDSEGTPVSIIEAQAAGLPVVSTKHAGIADVVVESKTGYLVEEGDVDGMATKISDLLSDLNKASKMGNDAKERIIQHFPMKKHIEKIELAIYG